MADDLKELKIELSKNGIFTTTMEELYNWGRRNSVWPLTFGLACCAIEMIATTMARYDLARFGAEVFRPSPRQADLIIPVDVHIPGCPPRPEALIHAFMTLQKKIENDALRGPERPRHLDPDAPSEFPVPEFGEHGLEPPNNPEVFNDARGNPLKVIQ
jgi:NADH-quinone oxidoreductase subunit B